MIRTIAEHTFPSGQILRLHQGDITEEETDAIVNAANAQLIHGGGVAGVISRRGGPEIQAQSSAWIRKHGPVSHDRPAITSAGKLPCRYVIHAVGPVWGEGDEDSKLSAAVIGALNLAAERELGSIALPAISTGIFGFPKDRAAGVILDAVDAFCAQGQGSAVVDIRITLFDQPTVDAFAQAYSVRWSDPGG